MDNIDELEIRIKKIEKEINCKDLEKRLVNLENEIKHIKAILQYQMRNKNK
tara:strand:+ start:2662 stop:2814 length:153 start_codon:yes stop_codon:yes gene_type:complete